MTRPLRTYIICSSLLCAIWPDAVTAQLISNCLGATEGNGGFSIQIETVATNIGPITNILGTTTDLTGYNCYRLYLSCEDSTDLLQAVFGEADNPTSINTSTSFYQTPLGGSFSYGISPALFPVFPELGFDSWLTIGMEGPANISSGEIEIQSAEDNTSPISGSFAMGGNLNIDSPTGSTWYVGDAENASNCSAGSDLKVLFAQLTTDGALEGIVNFQAYRDGVQESANCIRPQLAIPNFFDGGCLDTAACNFDPLVTFDNGTCDYCSCSETETTILQSASFPNDSLLDYSLEIDLIASHDTTDLPSLFGMNTYRFYIKIPSSDEKVTAVFGDANIPLDIQTTTGFFQSIFGGVTPNTVYPALFPSFPEVEYDSWVTIGIDKTAGYFGSGYGDISTASDPNTPPSWMSVFDPGGGVSGGNIFANSQVGGLWYTLTNNDNVIPDENNRVLIAQFTTDGIISGSLGAQILPPALTTENNEYYKLRFDFTTEGLGEVIDLPNPLCPCDTLPDLDGDGVCDVVDPCIGFYDFCGVCNGPGPIYECGCVEFPVGACDCAGNVYDVLGVCGGSCEADIDGDGVCDTDEIYGCTDTTACNFNLINTEEDGSCIYYDAVGVCGGDCAADVDGNGICDTVDALHCGPGTHWHEETGQCVISCPSDINLDGAVAIADLLALLSDFANFCEDLD